MSRSILRPSAEGAGAAARSSLRAAWSSSRARSRSSRNEANPSRRAKRTTAAALTPGALRERLRGVEGKLVQMLAYEREDALVVAGQPAAGLGDARVELMAEAEALRVRVHAHPASMSEHPA